MSDSRDRRPWRRRLLGPLILIALGALLLLNNLGVVPWEVWGTLWQLWPVLLVLLGLELLLTGGASWGAVLFAVLVLFVGSFIAGGPGPFGGFARSAAEVEALGPSMPFSQPLAGAQTARVQVDFGAGRFSLGSGAAAGYLVEGELRSNISTLSRHYEVQEGTGTLSLASLDRHNGIWWPFGRNVVNQLDLRLTPEVPLQQLKLNIGAANTSIDLSDLPVQNLELQTGASQALVRLPAQGQVSAVIKAGASHLRIEIPTGVAAHIQIEGGLSGVSIDEQRFPKIDGEDGVPGLAVKSEYRSPDYDRADNRVDLHISSGAASVEVR